MRLIQCLLPVALCALVPAVAAPGAAQPMHELVVRELMPQIGVFANKLRTEKAQTRIAGQPAFNGKDKFLPGKVALGLSYHLLDAQRAGSDTAPALQDFRAAADMMVGMENHTWGIYYYLLSLYHLKEAGLLERALSPATLASLQRTLDWRTFVTPDFKLVSLPTNYYGVAFGVARLRMLLGWEDENGSRKLLDKLTQHYDAHSGKYGWSDETDGEGRFDRYSILLAAEVCERFIDTGLTPTAAMKARLRQAADVAMSLGSAQGDGFTFGRSIGAYGDTGVLEILSIAAYLDVLTPEEKEYAYAYSTAIMARYTRFWYDGAMQSVDMWNKGRRTDAYRGIHRILGENFSLLHQLIKTDALWRKAGFDGTVPKGDFPSWFDRNEPRFRLTWFARGEYDRALAVYRARNHVFSLLLVNGGAGQHANSPYFPLPFANGVVAGVADSGPRHAQLLPKFTLADGTELVGTSFIKDIRNEEQGSTVRVSYRQDALARASDNSKAPVPDARLTLATTYTLEEGAITRTDTYTPQGPLDIKRIDLEFASFSAQATVDGTRVVFGSGDVTGFEVTGLPNCSARALENEAAFRAPTGPMQTLVTCSATDVHLAQPLTIRWRMQYR